MVKAFIAILLLGYSLTASAKTAIHLGIEDLSYLPFYAVDPEGGGLGFFRDVFDLFEAEKPYIIVYHPFPVGRLIDEYVQGKLDAKFPDNPAWAKTKKTGLKIIYSEPMVEFTDGLLVRSENLGKKVVKLGIIRGFTPWFLTSQIENGTIVLVENVTLEGLLKSTIQNRVDAAFANVDVAMHMTTEILFNKDLVFDPKLPHETSYYYVSSISHPEFINDFNDFFKANQLAIGKLVKKYGIQKRG